MRFPTVNGSNLAGKEYISRTTTLYTDKKRFRLALDLPSEDHIYVLRVDRRGEVLWRTAGAYRSDPAKELTATVEQQMAIV